MVDNHTNDTKIARLEVKMEDVERRCDLKEKDVKHIKDKLIPDIYTRLRSIDGWNKYAMGWAAGFGLIAVFIANKMWS